MRLLSMLFLIVVSMAAIPAAASAQAAKPGAPAPFRAVTISSQPDAKVWIDGVYRGKTDKVGLLDIKTVASGAHTLKIRADGYKETSQPLAATQKGDIKIILVKTTDEAELAFQEGERLAFVDREKSVEAYSRAVRLRPNYPDAFVGLARVQAELGDIEEAKQAILTARKLRANFAEAAAVQGRIHKEYGEDELAIAAFKRAITEGKGFQPEAYAGLGLLYKEKAEGLGSSGDFNAEDENYAEAAKNLKTAIKQLSGAPDTLVIYQILGLIYEREKKYNEAIAVYEEFLRIFPNSSEATAVRSFITQIKKNMADQD